MILNVTPGINLNAVSGPISKSQINQLGQPVVTLSPGSVVAADTSFNSLRITDGSYPFLHLKNTGAPVDKKNVRGYVELGGKVEISRLNDAEMVGTNLIAWDVNNNCGIGTGVPQAKQHVVAPALSSVSGSIVDIARFDTTNPNVSYLRLMEVRNSTGGDWTTATTRLQKWVDAVPQGFIEFNPAGLSYAVALGSVNGGGANVNVLTVTGSAGGNNVGIGTPVTPEKLSVSGNIRLTANGTSVVFTDTGGTTPLFSAAPDGNFYFNGTTAAGAQRSIWACAMRSDTSPLQVNVPLKIGAAGTAIQTVLTTVYTGPTRTLAAGTTASNTITLTGVPNTSVCALTITPTPASWVDDRIVISARLTGNPNEVKVVWYNPSAVSISLGSEQYRIEATIY